MSCRTVIKVGMGTGIRIDGRRTDVPECNNTLTNVVIILRRPCLQCWGSFAAILWNQYRNDEINILSHIYISISTPTMIQHWAAGYIKQRQMAILKSVKNFCSSTFHNVNDDDCAPSWHGRSINQLFHYDPHEIKQRSCDMPLMPSFISQRSPMTHLKKYSAYFCSAGYNIKHATLQTADVACFVWPAILRIHFNLTYGWCVNNDLFVSQSKSLVTGGGE